MECSQLCHPHRVNGRRSRLQVVVLRITVIIFLLSVLFEWFGSQHPDWSCQCVHILYIYSYSCVVCALAALQYCAFYPFGPHPAHIHTYENCLACIHVKAIDFLPLRFSVDQYLSRTMHVNTQLKIREQGLWCLFFLVKPRKKRH